MSDVLIDLFWTLPLIGVVALERKLLGKSMPRPALVALAAITGGVYAYLVMLGFTPFLVPVRLPLLPYMLTVGVLVVLFPFRPSAITVPAWITTAVLLLLAWPGTLWLSSYLEGRAAFDLYVIKLHPDNAPLHWQLMDAPLASASRLTEAQRASILRQAGRPTGVLLEGSSLGSGGPTAASPVIVLVMDRNVTAPVSLPVPVHGTAIFFENADGTFRQDLSAATMKASAPPGLQLTPDPVLGTSMQVTGAFGSIGTAEDPTK